MASSAPRVSLLMPMRNAEQFLPAALASILAQDFGDFELIGVDDGSTDATAETFRRLGDQRCRLVTGTGRGISHALNLAAAAAEGEYLARMDADDECTPDRLQSQMDLFAVDPALVCVASDYSVIDSAGRTVGSRQVPLDDLSTRGLLLSHNPFAHGSAVIKRVAFEQVGGYRTADEPAEDYAMWLRLAEIGRFAAVPSELYCHRTHSGQVSKERAEAQQAAAAAVAALARAQLTVPSLDSELIASSRNRHARDAGHARIFDIAARELVLQLVRIGRRAEARVLRAQISRVRVSHSVRQRTRHRLRLVKAEVRGVARRWAARSTSQQ